MTEDDYSLTQVDERVVIVSFGLTTDPWVLEFNKESTGYYFSDFLMLSDYEEELSKILAQWVTEPLFNEVGGAFNDGLAPVKDNLSNWGFVNEQGYLEIEGFDYARQFSEGLAAVSIDEKYGVINEYGEFVIEPEFDSISEFHEGLAAVMVGEKWGFIDTHGNIVIEPTYQYVGDFTEGLAWVEIDRKFGYIDKNGNATIPIEFEVPPGNNINSFSEGLAVVENDSGEMGYIDKEGDWVIDPKFLDAGDFREGLAYVLIEDKFLFWGSQKYGYINQDGEFVIEPQFNDARSFYDGKAPVETKDDQIGFINTEGELVTDTVDGGINMYQNGILSTLGGDLMTTDGNLIETGMDYSFVREIYDNGDIAACLNYHTVHDNECGLIRLNSD